MVDREINPSTGRPIDRERHYFEGVNRRVSPSFSDVVKTFFVEKKRKEGIQKLAEYLYDNYNFKTLKKTKEEEMYIYRGGIYVEEGKRVIKEEVENILREEATTHIIREVTDKIARSTYVDEDEFKQPPPNKICLENGVYDIKTKKLEEHNPEYFFRTKIPAKYRKDVKYPKIKNFLNDILPYKSIKVIQEWVGFCLYREYFIKKAMIFLGETNTGKTTLMNLLVSFFGEENTISISLQNLHRKFSAAFLHNKHLNIYDDLSYKDVKDTGLFKMAVGVGYIPAEKKFGDAFQFINFAKHTFATNRIPPVRDETDEAYFNRWIIITFNKTIDNPNPFLIKELTKEEELSGMLNWALEGLERLLEEKRFSYDKSMEEIKSMMQRSGNPLSSFVQDYCSKSLGSWISKKDFYKKFKKYCKKTDMPLWTKHKVGRNLKNYADYVETSSRDSGKVAGWSNISISDKLNKEVSDLESLTPYY